MKSVTPHEFWKFWGIVLAAVLYGVGGSQLWKKNTIGLVQAPNMGRWMKEYRFKEIKSLVRYMYRDEDRRESDPWWEFVQAVEDFNENRRKTVAASLWKVFDESMSAWCPQTTKTGGLPNISFVERKPEPLGTEFKNVCCGITGIMLGLEIQRGKYNEVPLTHSDLNATNAVSLRLAQLSARTGQEKPDEDNGNPPSDLFQGDSWFASIPTVENIVEEGHRFKKLIKTAHSLFPLKWLQETMNNFPGGTHLVMESEKNGKKIYAIGYKYSSRKVLCFVASEGCGSTLPGKPYEARWTDRHGNVHSRLVPRPEIISTFFEHNNKIDMHNQARQADLQLEKDWKTHNPYFRLITTLLGMVVTDCWKGYRYSLNSRNPEKEIPIRAFCNLLVHDLLNNDESNLRPEDLSATLPFLGPLPGVGGPSPSHHPQGLLPGDCEPSASNHHGVRELEMTDLSRNEGGGLSSLSGESGRSAVGTHTLRMYESQIGEDGVVRARRN